MSETQLATALAGVAQAVEAEIDRLLPLPATVEARVHAAMRYALFAGGKRLRPFLVMTSADLLGVPVENAIRAAAAVEMVHTYSLIHDDLPAMDDDDLRRGKPTCHREFDEATAILAGDALQPLAFRVLAEPETDPDAEIRMELVRTLADAIGADGMVGGQMIDLQAETETYDLAQITRLQDLKTGALISWSVEAGAILGRANRAERIALASYGLEIGLAFQIADDIMDVEGDEALAGKALHKDEAAGKATFVTLMGLERAREQAGLLVEQAIAHLSGYGDEAALLRAIAAYVVERDH